METTQSVRCSNLPGVARVTRTRPAWPTASAFALVRTHIHELLNHKDKTHQDTVKPRFYRGMLRTNPANP